MIFSFFPKIISCVVLLFFVLSFFSSVLEVNNTLPTSQTKYEYIGIWANLFSGCCFFSVRLFICLPVFRMFVGVAFLFVSTVIVDVHDAVFQFFYFCPEKTVIPKLR